MASLTVNVSFTRYSQASLELDIDGATLARRRLRLLEEGAVEAGTQVGRCVLIILLIDVLEDWPVPSTVGEELGLGAVSVVWCCGAPTVRQKVGQAGLLFKLLLETQREQLLPDSLAALAAAGLGLLLMLVQAGCEVALLNDS